MRPESVILWCRSCAKGYGSLGKVPPVCPWCDTGPVDPALEWWTLHGPPDVPKQPYDLTENDRAFLHRRGIKES